MIKTKVKNVKCESSTLICWGYTDVTTNILEVSCLHRANNKNFRGKLLAPGLSHHASMPLNRTGRKQQTTTTKVKINCSHKS